MRLIFLIFTFSLVGSVFQLNASELEKAIDDAFVEPMSKYPQRLGGILGTTTAEPTIVGQKIAAKIFQQEAKDSSRTLTAMQSLIVVANGKHGPTCLAMLDQGINLIENSGGDATAIMLERSKLASLIESQLIEKNMRFDIALADRLGHIEGKAEEALRIYRRVHRFPLTRIRDPEVFKKIGRHQDQAQLAIIYHLRGDLVKLQSFKESLSPIYTSARIRQAVDAAIESPNKDIELILRQISEDN